MGACLSKRRKGPHRARFTVTVSRDDEQTHGPRQIVYSHGDGSTDNAVRGRADTWTSDNVYNAIDGLTGGNFNETDTSLAAFGKVFSVLVDCMVPDPVLDNLLELGFHHRFIRDIREERLTRGRNRKLIETIQKEGYEAYAKFKLSLTRCGQDGICSLLERAEKGENTSDIQEELRKKVREQRKRASEDDRLCKDLKEDLIAYYRENESHIPASPLVDEHNVPIEDLYVLPALWAYTKPYNFGSNKSTQKEDEKSENDGQQKQKITINQLFVNENVRFRKIYITANAGFGKTSLSQKLTMTWCQSHIPLTILKEKYEDEELNALKYFDLVFLLHLRYYQSDSKCNLDDLIMKMVSENMSRKSQYTNEFIERILHDKNCLIILDGLDEWAHPGHCSRKPEVPHNNHPGTCTVVTTTRDWKIGTIGLSAKDIDRGVELAMLDDETRNQLEKNAFGILNEKHLNLAGNTVKDFDEEVETVEIGDIISIPYILLQLMCLFFGGLSIGKSKCQIYSNITEFTLERGLNKNNLSDIEVQSNDNAVVPNCMKENETCRRCLSLLMNLGKLAFYTLFSEKRESSLIFDKKIVFQYMTEQEIEICLKVGLLSQTKDSNIIAVKRYQVFFQHKSVQEFFSALYITSEWQNESVKLSILNVCLSLSDILELSNLFIFVCGINPNVYTCISSELQKIGDLDLGKNHMRISFNEVEKLCYYQWMQMLCLEESMRNGNESCPINFYVVINVFSDIYLTALKTSIHFNRGNVKSLLLLYMNNEIKTFTQSLGPGVFTSMETLRVEECDEEPVWLTDILTESCCTLKCLKISAPISQSLPLSDISITALTRLACLQSLYIGKYVLMTHSNLKCLYAFIGQATTLTQLKLVDINCSDHRYKYHDCDVTLDLHLLNELECVKLKRMSLTSAAWRTLLLSVGGLPRLVKVNLSFCKGPKSRGDWQEIVNVILLTTSLSIFQDFKVDRLCGVSLILENKTVC